jgi:hypothetical protein
MLRSHGWAWNMVHGWRTLPMNDNLPYLELPEFATVREQLERSIELAREAVSMRVGYEVEMAGLEPIDREGHAHMRVYWRRKPAELRIVRC